MTRAEGEEPSKRRGTDRAVSPVIAVILMVAVTVILAAVIGVFALDFGDESQADAPRVVWGHNTYDDASGDLEELEIVHRGGAELQLEDVNVTIDGTDAGDDLGANFSPPSGEMRSSDRFAFEFGSSSPSYSAGDEIRIVWSAPESLDSQTIHTYELERDTV